jgi:hypothetical protein
MYGAAGVGPATSWPSLCPFASRASPGLPKSCANESRGAGQCRAYFQHTLNVAPLVRKFLWPGSHQPGSLENVLLVCTCFLKEPQRFATHEEGSHTAPTLCLRIPSCWSPYQICLPRSQVTLPTTVTRHEAIQRAVRARPRGKRPLLRHHPGLCSGVCFFP